MSKIREDEEIRENRENRIFDEIDRIKSLSTKNEIKIVTNLVSLDSLRKR